MSQMLHFHRGLAEQRAGRLDFRGQVLMLRRINLSQSAGQNRQSSASSLQGTSMRSPINPARQAANHGESLLRQASSQALRDALAVPRALPRSDDGNGGRITR